MIKKACIILLLTIQVVSFNWAQSDNSVLDSLQNILDNTTLPDQKIDLLIEMGNHVRVSQSVLAATEYIDKALIIAREQQDDELIAKIYIEQGKVFAGQAKYDEAYNSFNNALIIYEASGNEEKILRCLNGLGIISRRNGNYIEAVRYLEKAKTYFSDSLSVQAKGAVLSNLSNAYARINQFELAYETLFESLKFYEEANDTHGIGLLYGNLGILYQNQDDHENGILYHKKSLEILEKENDLRGQLNAYNNLATTYSEQEEFGLALEANQKQLELAKQLQTAERIITSKIAIAGNYILLDNLSKAENILEEVSEPIQELSERYIYNYYTTAALLFEEKKEYKKAIKLSEKAYQIAKKQGDYIKLASVLEQLHILHQKNGDNTKAYEYLLDFKTASDSLSNQSNLQELVTQELKFEFNKTQETLSLEKEALESKLKVQNITRWAALVFAFLIGVIGFLSYRYYKRENRLLKEDLKNKKTIEEQSKQLQLFNTQLEETVTKRTAELKQANYELRTFNYIASHDIKEPIRNIGNYAGLIFKKLPENLQENLGGYFTIIKQGTTQLYTLIEDFTRYTMLSKDEAIEGHEVNLNDLIDGVEKALYFSIKKYNGTVINNGFPIIKSSSSLLYTMLKNVIDNGLKYNKSTVPTVELTYKETETTHKIIISDNGIGIDEAYHEHVFEMFKRLHNRGEYEGSGIGLAIAKLVTDKLNGSIQIESKENEGSRFIIELPR